MESSFYEGFFPPTSNKAIPSCCICKNNNDNKSICLFCKSTPVRIFFSCLLPEGCFIILPPKKKVNVQSAHETLLFNKPGLGQLVRPAHSSAHSRLGVMKICIYIVPCTCHDGIAVGGSAPCQKVTCVPDLMS